MRLSLVYRLSDSLLLCQSLGSTGDKSFCKVGIIRIYVLWRWQFAVIIRKLQCHRAQTSQVLIFWEYSNGIRVNLNVAVVDVVSQQLLRCTEHYRPPHTKVMM